MSLLDDVKKLEAYFISKTGGAVSGGLKPSVTDTHNLGTTAQRWNVLYAKTVIADSIEGGGGGGGDADSVDGFHAAGNPIAGYLLALNPQSVFPDTVLPNTLLKDGSRALEDHLSVVAGATIDGVDIGSHDHTGGSMGVQLDHGTLIGLDADDHPQYTQRAQDEIITGDWMFTHLQDRSAGWVFLPDDKVFKAVPHNMTFKATATEASLAIGPLSESEPAIMLYDDTTPTSYIKVGRSTNCIYLSGTNATARLWSGAANPADASFKVNVDGSIEATAGLIGNWTIEENRIYSNNLELNSAGRLVAGTGNDIIQIDAADATWRLWAGDADAADAVFRVSKLGQVYLGNAYVTGTLRSQNFISGLSGFSLDSNGLAEFENIIARGKLICTVFAEATVQCASGRLIISDGTVLTVDVQDTDDFIIVDAPVFEANDILRIKPAVDRDEWMSISGTYEIVGDGFKYYVVRGLNYNEPGYTGPYDFYAGEVLVRHGNKGRENLGTPLSSGESGGEFGEYQPGGSPTLLQGGLLVLEGSRAWGPYFGVQARYGAIYNQLTDVVRIGNLRGVLDYSEDEWGGFFGDDNDYMVYDQTDGLRINTREGSTTINNSGIATDIFSLLKVTSAPSYVQNQAKLFFVDDSGLKLRTRMKVDTSELQRTLMFTEVYDTDADGKVETADLADQAYSLTGLSPVEGDYIRRGASSWQDATITTIRNDLLTVDGSGSGLDADKLDGVEGAAYAALADTETVAGAWTFSNVVKLDNYADIKDITVPGTPASGYGRLYVANNNLLYKNDEGDISVPAAAGNAAFEIPLYAHSGIGSWHHATHRNSSGGWRTSDFGPNQLHMTKYNTTSRGAILNPGYLYYTDFNGTTSYDGVPVASTPLAYANNYVGFGVWAYIDDVNRSHGFGSLGSTTESWWLLYYQPNGQVEAGYYESGGTARARGLSITLTTGWHYFGMAHFWGSTSSNKLYVRYDDQYSEINNQNYQGARSPVGDFMVGRTIRGSCWLDGAVVHSWVAGFHPEIHDAYYHATKAFFGK